MTDLVIRGSQADLERLRREIESAVGRDARLLPLTSSRPGELREAILIGILVSLALPPVAAGIISVLKRFRGDRDGSDSEDIRLADVDDDGNETEVEIDELESRLGR